MSDCKTVGQHKHITAWIPYLTQCASCQRDLSDEKTKKIICSGCGFIRYCDETCQKKHSEEHRIECQFTAQIFTLVRQVNDPTRARIVIMPNTEPPLTGEDEKALKIELEGLERAHQPPAAPSLSDWIFAALKTRLSDAFHYMFG